jgi:DNA-binding response OmpR family regulator
MRILLIEDDQELAGLLLEGLSKDGFIIEQALNAKEGFALATLDSFAVIILDVMLPEGDEAGFLLIQRLRQAGLHTPILFLTARADMNSKLQGLELGGDDYLAKPFDFRELRARLRSLVRRSTGRSSNRLELPFELIINLETRQVLLGEQQIHLTPREYTLLEYLALNAGRIFSREDLIERIWSNDSSVTSKIVDVYVSSLRRKLHNNLVETVRGRGYTLGAE